MRTPAALVRARSFEHSNHSAFINYTRARHCTAPRRAQAITGRAPDEAAPPRPSPGSPGSPGSISSEPIPSTARAGNRRFGPLRAMCARKKRHKEKIYD
jgi:hypothetical protein